MAMTKKNLQTPVSGAQKSPAEDTSGLGTVVVRNEFYRDGYRSLLRLVLIQGLLF